MLQTYLTGRFKRHCSLIIFLLVLVGVTATSAIQHTEHTVDQDCVICQLRHQSATRTSEAPSFVTNYVSNLIEREQAPVLIVFEDESGASPRAPPTS